VNQVTRFRNEWLPLVPRWYSARWHYFGTTAVSFPLIAYGMIGLYRSWNSSTFRFWELIAIPLFLMTASLVEYLVHRYPLHHRLPLGGMTYQQHTLRHHQYFTDEAIEARLAKEYHLVLFPVWGVVLIQYGVNLPLSLLTARMLGDRIGMIALVIGVFFFFIYETVHAICHFPAEAELFKIRWIWNLREHHRIHHRKSLMSNHNFNIVYPFWDRIFRTKF